MLRPCYESVPVPYRDAALTEDEQYSTVFPDGNAYLITPPRIYYEELWSPGIQGLAAVADPSLHSPVTIYLQGKVRQVEWPGYNLIRWAFDGQSGAYIGRQQSPNLGYMIGNNWYQRYLTTSGDGSVWAAAGYAFPILRFDSTLGEVLETVPGSHWGNADDGFAWRPYLFFVDQSRDLVVGFPYFTGVPFGGNDLFVWTLSTGAFVRRIAVAADQAVDVFREDGSRCYTVSSAGVLTLVDYVSGQILGVMGLGESFEVEYGKVRCAWDSFARRILVAKLTPNEPDGASTVAIRGFYPLSIAVSMSTPIALRKPRKGRSVPVVVELRGDAGETVTGVEVRLTEDGPGTTSPARRVTDSTGLARFTLACDDAGSQDLDAEATTE